MTPILVQLGPMPMMLRTIVRDLLSAETDVRILDSTSGRDDCLRAAREAKADLVIVQDEAQEGTSCLDLLLTSQGPGLLGIAADGRSATRISIAREPVSLDAGLNSSLADAIRQMAGDRSRASTAAAICAAHPAITKTEVNAIPASDKDAHRQSGDR